MLCYIVVSHLGERCVLRVESVKLRLLLHDQSPELLLLRLPLLGVGLQQVAGADSLDLLLLHLLGHRVEYHNETVRDFLNMFILLYHDTLKHHTLLLMLYLEVSNVTEEILAHLLEFLSLGRGILVEHSDPVEVVKVEASLVQSLGRHVVTSAASLNHLFQINLTVDTRWLGWHSLTALQYSTQDCNLVQLSTATSDQSQCQHQL